MVGSAAETRGPLFTAEPLLVFRIGCVRTWLPLQSLAINYYLAKRVGGPLAPTSVEEEVSLYSERRGSSSCFG